jgi:hypothetical protein
MLERIIRIVKLDFSVFKEIESDPEATTQAAIIVVAASVLSGIGSAIATSTSQGGVGRPIMSFISAVISGVVGWIVWSLVSHFVGKSLFNATGSLENLLRVIGYANAPQLLGVLAFIPCLGWLAALAGAIIALIASIMAIAEGLNLPTGQAVIVAIIGWLGLVAVSTVIGLILGVGAAGLGALAGAFH